MAFSSDAFSSRKRHMLKQAFSERRVPLETKIITRLLPHFLRHFIHIPILPPTETNEEPHQKITILTLCIPTASMDSDEQSTELFDHLTFEFTLSNIDTDSESDMSGFLWESTYGRYTSTRR